MQSFRIGLLALLVLSWLGCASSKKADLQASVELYVRSLQRDDTVRAGSFVKPKLQDEFFKNMQALSNWRISNAEVRTIYPDDGLKSAVASVFFEFYSQNGGELKTAKRFFRWEYDEKRKAWLLAEAKPFGVN